MVQQQVHRSQREKALHGPRTPPASILKGTVILNATLPFIHSHLTLVRPKRLEEETVGRGLCDRTKVVCRFVAGAETSVYQ